MYSIISQLDSLSFCLLQKFKDELKKHLDSFKKDSLATGSQADLNKIDFQMEFDSLAKEGTILQVISPVIFKLCDDMNKKARATTTDATDQKESNSNKTDIEKAFDLFNMSNDKVKKEKIITLDDVLSVLIEAIRKSHDSLTTIKINEYLLKCEMLLEIINLIDPELEIFSFGLIALNRVFYCLKNENEEKLESDELMDGWVDEFNKLDSVQAKENSVPSVDTFRIDYCLAQFKLLKNIKLISEVVMPELISSLGDYEKDERKAIDKCFREDPVMFKLYFKNDKNEMKSTSEVMDLIKKNKNIFAFVEKKIDLKLITKCGILLGFNKILQDKTKKCSERLDELENIVEGTIEILFENRSHSAISFFRCLARIFHIGGRLRSQKIIEDKLRPKFALSRLFYCFERDKIPKLAEKVPLAKTVTPNLL